MRRIFNDKGFTILELLIVVVIFGILLTIAYPKFEKEKARWELNTAARQMVSDIRNYQQQAVLEQKTYRLLLGNNNHYSIRDGMDTVHSRDLGTLISQINYTSGLNEVEFRASGTPNKIGHFTLFSKDNEYKYIILYLTGRVRISSTL